MLGQTLIDKTRVILRDRGRNNLAPLGDTMNSVSGQFWSDYEVLVCLNIAQDYVINRAILLKDTALLQMLIVQGVYQTAPSNPLIPHLNLPNDYLQYIDGKVGSAPNYHIARIYLCGDAIPFLHAKHDAIYILRDTIIYNNMGNYNVGGILNYYKRPTKIVQGEFENSFVNKVYYDYIVRYGAALLSTKEIHTQRDYKNYRGVIDEMRVKPKQPSVPTTVDL